MQSTQQLQAGMEILGRSEDLKLVLKRKDCPRL